MQFLHSVLVQDESLAVSTVRTDDLPVNPLSVILLTLRNLNNTGTLTNYQVLQGLLTQISRVEILYQGSAIIAGSLADLARLYGFLVGRVPRQGRMVNTDNDVRWVTVPILLGRRPFWKEECFPAVRRGELQLQTTSAAAQTGIDTLVMQIETVELLGATPKRYLKATTITKTPSATGDHDVDLPIGNKLAGILGFSTTVPSGTSFNASLGQLRLLLDNVEAYFARTNFESLNGMASLFTQSQPQADEHLHLENTAALYTQNADTDLNEVNPDFFENYVYMNFSPFHDEEFLVETKGRARVHLRINQEPTADAIRIMPVELVDVAAAA